MCDLGSITGTRSTSNVREIFYSTITIVCHFPLQHDMSMQWPEKWLPDQET